MPITIPIQTSFAGGEISPKLMGRVEADLYKKAVSHCENFEPLAYGPMLMKGGTRWAALCPNLDSTARILDFPRQGEVGFLVLLGYGELRVLNAVDGSAISATTIDRVSNPNFSYGWQYWTRYDGASQGADAHFSVVNGRYLFNTIHNPFTMQGLAQATASLAAGTYTLRIRYSTAGASYVHAGITSTVPFDILDENLSPTYGLANHATVERTVVLSSPGSISVGLDIPVACTRVPELVAGGEYSAEVLEISLRSVAGGTAVWNSGTTPPMPWSNEKLEELQVVAEPARDRLMFFHPDVAPHELLFDRVTGAWAFQAITFVLPVPPPWNYGDFVGRFPGTAELYQGRLIVGGIKGKENTVLASASGQPYNFLEPDLTAAASNADPFSLDVSTKGAWRWMQGHRTLLMGTDKGEFILTAQAGVLTPSDFEVRAQSGFGSASVQAIHLGELVLYVSRDRRRLRMLSYNQQENGWQTRDLTFTSEHLTGGLVREVHWISTGNDKVVAILRSGDVMAWTFHHAESVIAPWRVNFGGPVHSMAVVDCGDSDKVWMLVQRTGGVMLEEWIVDDDPNRVVLDSWRTGALDVDGKFYCPQLAGQVVIPILDGVVQPSQVVAFTGYITLAGQSGNVVVGLFNPPSFTTLRHEGGNPAGTTQGAKQRPVKLSLRLNDSALPLVNGVRCGADRTPATPMDTVEGRQTGDFTVRVLGWEDGAAVTVSQDVPIRTEVLAMFGIVASREV